MSKEIFKVGDRVYHIEYGWGEVVETYNGISFPILVEFANDLVYSFTLDGREITESKQPMLSFTEYTLQGFSQERLVVLPEVGELCLVRNADDEEWKAIRFFKYCSNYDCPYVSKNRISYLQLKRIKILD